MNVTVTADYIKWTITFAAVGLAYVQKNLLSVDDVWGFNSILGILPASKIPFAAQVLFLLSVVCAIIVISAITGHGNDQAREAAGLQAKGGKTPAQRAESRLTTVRFWGNVHLATLGVGFALAALPFADEAWHGKAQPERCTVERDGVVLTFDCDAKLAEALSQ
jgi:hypothetical protein